MKRVLEAVKQLTLVWLLLAFGVLFYFLEHPVKADEPTKSWTIYQDDHFKLIKVQDGSCSIYITEPDVNHVDPTPTQLQLGQGCK